MPDCFPSHECAGEALVGLEVTDGVCPAVGSPLLSLSHCAGAMPPETLFLPIWLDRAEVISL